MAPVDMVVSSDESMIKLPFNWPPDVDTTCAELFAPVDDIDPAAVAVAVVVDEMVDVDVTPVLLVDTQLTLLLVLLDVTPAVLSVATLVIEPVPLELLTSQPVTIPVLLNDDDNEDIDDDDEDDCTD